MIRVNLLGLPRKVKRGAPVITLEGTPIMILFAVVLLLWGCSTGATPAC